MNARFVAQIVEEVVHALPFAHLVEVICDFLFHQLWEEVYALLLMVCSWHCLVLLFGLLKRV